MQGKKIMNHLIDDMTAKHQLEPMALWVRCFAFLSNPSLANMPNGGFKEYILKHSPNCRDNINAWWQQLKNDGYLKRLRYPYEHNKFKVDWVLFDQPTQKIPTEQNLKTGQILPAMDKIKKALAGSSSSRIADYAAREMVYAREPEAGEHYTYIPMDLIRDDRIPLLSLAIYIVARRLIDRWEMATDPDWEITKGLIRHITGLRYSKFHTAWMRLKRYGYLEVLRGYCKTHHRPEYQYRLYPLSEFEIKRRAEAQKAAARPGTGQLKTKTNEEGKDKPNAKGSLEAVTEEIRSNIEYDLLLANREAYAKERGLYYDKREVDGWLRLIVDTIRSDKPHVYINKEPIPTRQVADRFRRLEHEHILYVMDAVSQQTIKGNARSYKLTCLYNALDTLPEYENGVIKYSMD